MSEEKKIISFMVVCVNEFAKKYNISPAQITRLKRNESVSTHTIEMFCKILKCNVEDIMQFIDEEEM